MHARTIIPLNESIHFLVKHSCPNFKDETFVDSSQHAIIKFFLYFMAQDKQ